VINIDVIMSILFVLGLYIPTRIVTELPHMLLLLSF